MFLFGGQGVWTGEGGAGHSGVRFGSATIEDKIQGVGLRRDGPDEVRRWGAPEVVRSRENWHPSNLGAEWGPSISARK